MFFNKFNCRNLFHLFTLTGKCAKTKPIEKKMIIFKKFIEFEDKPLSENEINEINNLGLKLNFFGKLSNYSSNSELSSIDLDKINKDEE